MSRHVYIREQVVQWLMGEPLDVPISAVVEHLCACPQCMRYAADLEWALSRLPEALPQRNPRPELRSAVLAAVRREAQGPVVAVAEDADGSSAALPGAAVAARGAPEAAVVAGEAPEAAESRAAVAAREAAVVARKAPEEAESRAAERPSGKAARTGWAGRTWYSLWRRVWRPVMVGLLLALAVGNVAFWRDAAQKGAELARLSERFATELNWLSTAESILVKGQPATVRLELAADEGGVAGQVALYHAYGDVHYLLVHVEGLAPGAAYQVWLADGTERPLGTAQAGEDGADTSAYRFAEGPPHGRLSVRAAESGVTLAYADLP